jgi:hypothetical protein
MVVTTTYQMVILMALSDEPIALCFLQEKTGINFDLIKDSLSTLLKAKILLRSAGTDETELTGNTVIKINTNFKAPKKRFSVVHQIQDRTIQDINNTKIDAVKCAIVRVLKSLKRVDHNTLMYEVTKQLANRFVPEIPMIKKTIENLIDQEYISRSPGNIMEYNYIA